MSRPSFFILEWEMLGKAGFVSLAVTAVITILLTLPSPVNTTRHYGCLALVSGCRYPAYITTHAIVCLIYMLYLDINTCTSRWPSLR